MHERCNDCGYAFEEEEARTYYEHEDYCGNYGVSDSYKGCPKCGGSFYDYDDEEEEDDDEYGNAL